MHCVMFFYALFECPVVVLNWRFYFERSHRKLRRWPCVALERLVCPQTPSRSDTGAATGSSVSPVLLLRYLLQPGEDRLTDASDDWFPWNNAAPSCFHAFLQALILGEHSVFANGKSGCRHRTVSSASPCERGSRAVRLPGGAEMDRGESRGASGEPEGCVTSPAALLPFHAGVLLSSRGLSYWL